MNYLLTLAMIVVGACLTNATNSRCYVPTTSEAFEKAKVVFVGKVISVEDPTLPAAELQPSVYDLVRPIRVRFNVEHVYRGNKVSEIELVTRTGGLEWGYEFKVGERYLVYSQANKAQPKGLIVEGCGRTRLITDATDDLRLLEAKAKDEQDP